MTTQFSNNRRNKANARINSVVKGQKPSCKIIVYPWQSPELVGLEAINLTTSGDFFNNTSKRNLTGRGRNPVKIDNDIVKCSIHKNKNSSSGGFSLVLKRGNTESGGVTTGNNIDYLRLINPGDWIAIYMKKDDDIPFDGIGSNREDSGLKMLGIVENVRFVEIDDPNQGTPRLEYVVTGRDFGKVFENEIFYNPVINSVRGIQNVLGISFLQNAEAQMGNKAKGSFLPPNEVVNNMIDFYLGGDGNLSSSTNQLWFVPPTVTKMMGVSGNTSFVSMLDKSRIGLQIYRNGVFRSAGDLLGETQARSLPYEGSVWSALQQYSNPVLNEMIVDLTNKNGRLVPSFQLRQVPYSSKSNSGTYVYNRSPVSALSSVVSNSEKTFLLDLPRHTIKSTDIKQKNVGTSDFERVNAVVVVPNIPTGQESKPIQQAYAMALNGPSIQRYGLKLLQANTIYNYTTDVDFTQYVSKITSLVSDWFMTAHLLYNGTIVTDGTDEFVEIGTNLVVEDVNQLFHIEGISYMYEINPNTGNTIYNTEFRVSRGQLVNDNISKSDFIGSPVELSSDQGVTVTTTSLENIRNRDRRDR